MSRLQCCGLAWVESRTFPPVCLHVLADSGHRSLEKVESRTLPGLVANDSTDKPKASTAGDGVMANLPATRPTRLSRRARSDADAAAEPKAAGAKPKSARAKPKPAAKSRSAAPARPKAATAASPKAAGASGRPQPVRSISPRLDGPARKADAGRGKSAGDIPPKQQNPVELATTVVKAAGEIAQIGATVAGQALKRAAGRLPRP